METVYILTSLEPWGDQPEIIGVFESEKGAAAEKQRLSSGKNVGDDWTQGQFFIDPIKMHHDS